MPFVGGGGGEEGKEGDITYLPTDRALPALRYLLDLGPVALGYEGSQAIYIQVVTNMFWLASALYVTCII